MADERDRFAALFEAHARAVLGYALRRVADVDDASDVVAEVFLVAWRRMVDVPADDRAARFWMYATARRVVANERRSAARRSRLTDAISACVPMIAPPPADGDDSVLEAALRQLSDEDRELVRLSSWEQLTPSEIAEVLGVSAGAARTRLHRARQRLASDLRARGWKLAGIAERSN